MNTDAIKECAISWGSLHGNIYDLGNGWFEGKLYNQLPGEGLTLDGHYTVIFTRNCEYIEAYKHGDYFSLIQIIPIDFNGFHIQSPEDRLFLKILVENTMKCRLPYSFENFRGSNSTIFDYDFELFGKPEYFDLLPAIVV
jgi:hypothetical protein